MYVCSNKKKHPLSIRFIRAFERLLIQSWWVLIVLFVCLNTYQLLNYQQNLKIAALQQRLFTLDEAILEAQEQQTFLRHQLESQDDYLWNELVLKKELGVVAPGETKVIFKKPR